MPVTMFAPTPVPSTLARNTTGHRPLLSGARPAPLKSVQHWLAAQPAGRTPTSHAAGGTRAPVAVARSSRYSWALHDAEALLRIAAIPTTREQMPASAVFVCVRSCVAAATAPV